MVELDRQHLESHNLVRSSPRPGFIRVHKRRLRSLGDIEYALLPILVPVLDDDANLDRALATIPERLVSDATRLHVGFTETRADSLWHKWTSLQNDENEDKDHAGRVRTFHNFVLSHILPDGVWDDDYRDNDDALWACLVACDIDKDLGEAIMEETFKRLREDDTCLGWIKDTVKMRYAGLEDIQRTSKRRAQMLSATYRGR
ncbi:hypothetical protein SEUCBS140593_004427 [Sporothrix eucalyptigena]|uniref:Uncharacterized protein n=1 Tax=Sporothrix eucalyptigena TaxID=1812306 RepID=A0ABP0BMZ5_9PEZI